MGGKGVDCPPNIPVPDQARRVCLCRLFAPDGRRGGGERSAGGDGDIVTEVAGIRCVVTGIAMIVMRNVQTHGIGGKGMRSRHR